MHQFDKFLSINVASDFSLINSLFFPNKWLNVSRWNICRIVHRELGLFMAVWIYSSDSALRSILLVMSFLQYVNTLLFIHPWPLTKFFFWKMPNWQDNWQSKWHLSWNPFKQKLFELQYLSFRSKTLHDFQNYTMITKNVVISSVLLFKATYIDNFAVKS